MLLTGGGLRNQSLSGLGMDKSFEDFSRRGVEHECKGFSALDCR